MAKNKRTKHQRELDRAETSKLYLHGLTQTEIARLMKVSQPQVVYDLAVIKERWQKEAAADLRERLAKEAARIDNLERELWVAFDLSQAKDDAKSDKPSKHGSAGNPQFAALILRCIELRCKLFGLIPKVLAKEPVQPALQSNYQIILFMADGAREKQ